MRVAVSREDLTVIDKRLSESAGGSNASAVDGARQAMMMRTEAYPAGQSKKEQ